jgi:cytochrome c-type biogenesis protein
VLLGATSTAIGHFLKGNQLIFRLISGSLMVLFGLNFMGLLRIPFINMEKRFDLKIKQHGFFSAVLFGLVFAFGWTPCLGTFLGSALIMAGNSDTLLQGVLMLLLYSIGLGIPFIVTSLMFGKVRKAFSFLKKHGRIINMVSGIVLILAGILVFTDRMKYINTIFS